MKKLLATQVLLLEKIGDKYKCKFYLPPFDSRNNPFYWINDIEKNAIKFREFLIEVKNVGVHHSFRTLKRKKYMEITGSE